MDFDCGRMGNLEGVFIADTEDVDMPDEESDGEDNFNFD